MKHFYLLIAALMLPLFALGDGWSTQYPEIEKNIRQPEFAKKEFKITKYGAKTGASAAVNQKAINKAIDACSKKGGGKVIVPEGRWLTCCHYFEKRSQSCRRARCHT